MKRDRSTAQQEHVEFGGFEQSSWTKRKFYIVENDGKPMEVYCTDLIHRAKHHRQRQRLVTEDGHRFLRVVDKWREEWNHGVQMPLGTSKDCFRTEQTALFPGLKTSECFQLPTKMVSVDVPSDSINTNRYTNEDHFQFVAKPPNLYYNLSKRNKNDKRPLIVEPEDSRSVAIGTAIPVVTVEPKIRRLRILSEKARNLCYMVTRREKLKKQCVELLEHQVKLTASNAFGRVPPVSSRSMERLLSEWREAANLNKTIVDNSRTGRKRK